MTSIALTDLQERLAGPQGPAERTVLLERLQALETRLRQRMAAGLPRAEYPDWAAAADAAAAAREFLSGYPVATAGPAAPG
ncbi:hypothetical protein V8Z80_13010 [Orrella sp. JC864]|uniref:hypothetical protein n=1 Tax=Orrella sp. JC864 TaxID=3120298 RepID=UPI00300A9E61